MSRSFRVYGGMAAPTDTEDDIFNLMGARNWTLGLLDICLAGSSYAGLTKKTGLVLGFSARSSSLYSPQKKSLLCFCPLAFSHHISLPLSPQNPQKMENPIGWILSHHDSHSLFLT